MTPNLLHSRKELAAALQRHRGYATDMTRAGFRLPNTISAAVRFLQTHPHPSRTRPNYPARRR